MPTTERGRGEVGSASGGPPRFARPIDLSRPLTEGPGIHPGDPGIEIGAAARHETQGYAVSALSLGSHSGTHVDAPLHFLPGGASVDRYAIDRFVGEALVIDARQFGRAESIAKDPLKMALESAGDLRGARMLLLWTGWDVHFGTEEMFAHPYLTPDAARFLIDAGIELVGTDTLSIDSSSAASYPVHGLLLAADVLVVENLTRLDALGEGRVFCALLPLALVGTDGAPVRAVAWRTG